MQGSGRRIASNSVYMLLRMVFVTIVTLFTSRIVLAQLGVVDFGIYNAVGGIVLFFSFIVPTLASSVQRFLNYYLGKQDLDTVSKVFSMSIIIHLIFSGIVVILGETVGVWFLNTHMSIPAERLSAANFVLQCSIVSLVAILMGIPYNALILANQRMKFYAKISVITVVLKVVTAILLICVSIDKLFVYAIFMLMIMISARMLASIYCRVQFKNCRFKFCWDKKLFGELFSFSGWNLYGNIGNMIYTYGINVVLNMFCGPVVNAARAISVQIQHVLDQTSNSFLTAVNPQITQSYAAEDYGYVEQLFLKASKYTFYIMALACVPLFFCMPGVLAFWLGQYPEHSVEFCRFVIVICWITAFFQPTYTILQSTGDIKKYQVIQGSSLICILPLAYIFLRKGYTPEVVFFISMIFILVSRVSGVCVMISKAPFLSIKRYLTVVIKNMGCILLPVIISSVFDMLIMNPVVKFLVITSSNSVTLLCIVYFFDFSKEELDFLKSLRKKKR